MSGSARWQNKGIEQRQTYVKVYEQLLLNTYNSKLPKRRKKAKSSGRKLNTIAGKLLRELRRNLPEQALPDHQEDLGLYKRVLAQKRTDKDKIYGLHKPFTCCIAKGKAHRQYEFCNKVGLIATGKELITTAIKNFKGNPHDSKTIEPLPGQMESNLGHTPKEFVCHRGGKGQKQVCDTIISTPDNRPPKARYAQPKKKEKTKEVQAKGGNRTCNRPLENGLRDGTELSACRTITTDARWGT